MYTIRDVVKLLGLPQSTVRSLIAQGFVEPTRGLRNRWEFSFRDLIVLRTAATLVNAKVSSRRIMKALRELRRQLPAQMPLSGLSISADGDQIVVKDGAARWQADSGQYVLGFEAGPAGVVALRSPASAAPAKAPASSSAQVAAATEEEWFEHAVALEDTDVDAAAKAYEKAIAIDPGHTDAHINLGRLLHESGRLQDATRAYGRALNLIGGDPVLLFNLGVLLEDMGRAGDALKAYEGAIRVNPRLADGHYNLGLLYEKLGRPREALRHMAQYRRLTTRR